jgi:hypothetical protein
MAAHKLKTLAGFLPLGDWAYMAASSGLAQFLMVDTSGTTYSVSKDCIERVEKKEEVKSGLFSKDVIFEVQFTGGQTAIFKGDESAFKTIFEAQYSSKKIPTQIVETKPNKLMNYAAATLFALFVIGVFSCSSKDDKSQTEEQTAKSFRTFTEKDFYFSKKEKPYKSVIVQGVNKVHREHPGCNVIDPGSASLSKEKGSKSNPVFFVTCGEGTNVFNVWFSKADIEKGAPVKVVKNLPEEKAVPICQEAARLSTTHPSTIDFGRWTINEHPNGNTSISQFFEAKNSFGLELKFRIDCLVNEKGLVQEPSIVEVAD